MVELALSSVVLILILLGVVDFARAYQFQAALSEAAREGAREAIFYDGNLGQNPYMDDTDIMNTVNTVLHGAGLPDATQQAPATCVGSGLAYGPPYSSALFPATANHPYVYICYNTSTGKPTTNGSGAGTGPFCTSADPNLTPNSPKCGGFDVQVTVLMQFALVVQSGPFGPMVPMVGYAHMRAQGS